MKWQGIQLWQCASPANLSRDRLGPDIIGGTQKKKKREQVPGIPQMGVDDIIYKRWEDGLLSLGSFHLHSLVGFRELWYQQEVSFDSSNPTLK